MGFVGSVDSTSGDDVVHRLEACPEGGGWLSLLAPGTACNLCQGPGTYVYIGSQARGSTCGS